MSSENIATMHCRMKRVTSSRRVGCLAASARNTFATRSATSLLTLSTLMIFGVGPGFQPGSKKTNASLYFGSSSSEIASRAAWRSFERS
jgi:hypothetical protein